jgi:hypothetical protein
MTVGLRTFLLIILATQVVAHDNNETSIDDPQFRPAKQVVLNEETNVNATDLLKDLHDGLNDLQVLLIANF